MNSRQNPQYSLNQSNKKQANKYHQPSQTNQNQDDFLNESLLLQSNKIYKNDSRSKNSWSSKLKKNKKSQNQSQLKKYDIHISNVDYVNESPQNTERKNDINQFKNINIKKSPQQPQFYQINGTICSKNQQQINNLQKKNNNKRSQIDSQKYNYFKSIYDNSNLLNPLNATRNNYKSQNSSQMLSLPQSSIHTNQKMSYKQFIKSNVDKTIQSAILKQKSIINTIDDDPAEEPNHGTDQNGLRYQLPIHIQHILNFDQTFEKIFQQQKKNLISIKVFQQKQLIQ